MSTLLHDTGRARLDKARDEIFRNPGIVFANQTTGFVASTVASTSMAIAKEIVELFLNRNKEVIMQEDFFRWIVVERVQRASVGFTKSEHFTSPKSELRGFSVEVRFRQDIPDSVEHGLRDQRLALSSRCQGLYVRRLDFFVLRVGRKARPLDWDEWSIITRGKGSEGVSLSVGRSRLLRV